MGSQKVKPVRRLEAGTEGGRRSVHTDSIGKAWGCGGPGLCREGPRNGGSFWHSMSVFHAIRDFSRGMQVKTCFSLGSAEARPELVFFQAWGTQAASVTTCTPLKMLWTYLRHHSACPRPLVPLQLLLANVK